MRLRDRVHNDHLPLSYYAAAARDKGDFSRLEGGQKVDICVVGGGFTGVSAALMLAEKGYKVALLEQNQIGWGASGRSGGQLLGGYGPDLTDMAKIDRVFGANNRAMAWGFGVECVNLVREIVERYKIECDLKWGYFDAAMNKAEMHNLEEEIGVLQEAGYAHHLAMVGQDALPDYLGSGRFIGGRLNMGFGHLQPLDLVRGEARAAEKRGAQIYENARVSKITYGDKVHLETETGHVIADMVFLAGNAYLGRLVPKIARQIVPVGSYMIATSPLPHDLRARLMPKDYAVCDQRVVLDYFRLSADGRLLFGGLANYSGQHPASIEKALGYKMLRVFPELKDYPIDYAWGGNLGISLNRVPQIGRVAKNVYYAQAYSGHGVAPTHMSAKLVVEAIEGQLTRFDVASKVKHWSLPGPILFQQQILALGMLWYRLKDALS